MKSTGSFFGNFWVLFPLHKNHWFGGFDVPMDIFRAYIASPFGYSTTPASFYITFLQSKEATVHSIFLSYFLKGRVMLAVFLAVSKTFISVVGYNRPKFQGVILQF